MKYYLGVDIGTTAVKAVGFSITGEVLRKAEAGFPMMHPLAGESEQDPDAIFSAVVHAVNEVAAALAHAVPILLSFSAAMHSLIAVDDTGKPMTACIIWADNRAAAIAAKLKNSAFGTRFYEKTGVPVHAMSPLCKILWLREHAPEIFSKTARFIGIKEYVMFQLFGEYVIDTGVASATGLLNLRTLKWDTEILDFAQIDASRLSRVVSVKESRALGKQGSATMPLNLPQDTKIIIGGSDGAMANIGTPMTENGMVITVGTSSAARVIVNSPITDKDMRTFCYHAMDNEYILGGAGNNGGIVLQWLRDNLLQTSETYDELFELAAEVPAGSDDLLFLPYLLGERSPIWDAAARGVFFGLTINHGKKHLVRATVEGVVYSIYSIGKVIMERHKVNSIYATGGFVRSKLWLQILADTFNLPVMVTEAVETSALGAVKVALESLGLEPMTHSAAKTVFQPDEARHRLYASGHQKFEKLYSILKDEFPSPTSVVAIP